MDTFESLILSLLVISPLILLVILMVQNRSGFTVVISCALIGLIAATILETSFEQHPHIPVPIWAMLQVVVAFIIPVLTVSIRFFISKTRNNREVK